MRLSLRFVLPLAVIISLIAYGIMPLVETFTLRWTVRDIDIRTKLITNAIQDSLIPLIDQKSNSKVVSLFNRVIQDERMYALGFCNDEKKIIFKTVNFPAQIKCDHSNFNSRTILRLPQGSLHVAFDSIEEAGKRYGELVMVHDLSFVERRNSDTKKYIFGFFVILGTIVSFITVLIAELSLKGWLNGVRNFIKGEGWLRTSAQNSTSREIRPIVKDLRHLVRELEADRRTRDENQISWSPKAIKEILQQELAGDEILIVSNREPYLHTKKDGKIEIQVPASGVVTALEPIMRACSGTWIAHGSGNADRETVDKFDRVRVPPENPSYQIRRVWLTPEEEAGFYFGFSNEGLWPLCHIAHTRPTFRTSDWDQYVAVNRKFAKAVLQEAKTEDPVILVQDYHFSLLPKMIKERLPKATIITFWHIPWPNPEAFGICPWRYEILNGLLGSSILGFHTQFHCNNFIEAVDRYLESRIDRETFTISYKGSLTAVNSYPISIEYPVRWLRNQKSIKECRRRIREMNHLPMDRWVGFGVDRLDYTKGILERFIAIERLLELEPKWIGKFTFIQVAAPSRSSIEQYKNFDTEVREMAKKINDKYASENYQPICLKIEHHEANQVFEYFRGSDLCFVSSLHDGMNLVAKEFVASRDDELGVLILSQFTGAARELPEALIVNPYDSDQCARALNWALEMPKSEQKARMQSMRGLIQEFNVYRWAGRMLIHAARIRQRSRFFGKMREKPLRLKLGSIQ